MPATTKENENFAYFDHTQPIIISRFTFIFMFTKKYRMNALK